MPSIFLSDNNNNINYSLFIFFLACSNLTVGAAAKTFYSKPTQRTINVTWEHDIRDEDTGFLLTWRRAPLYKMSSSIKLNRTVREHIFRDLGKPCLVTFTFQFI